MSGSATCVQNRTIRYARMLSRRKNPTTTAATNRGRKSITQPTPKAARECAWVGPSETSTSANPTHSHHARRFQPARTMKMAKPTTAAYIRVRVRMRKEKPGRRPLGAEGHGEKLIINGRVGMEHAGEERIDARQSRAGGKAQNQCHQRIAAPHPPRCSAKKLPGVGIEAGRGADQQPREQSLQEGYHNHADGHLNNFQTVSGIEVS